MNTFQELPQITNEKKELFWSRVDIKSTNECWNFKGMPASKYGRFKISGNFFLSHRIAWCLSNHRDPGKMLVCHKCDNPRCCNPSHLFLGTAHDNNMDSILKGRRNARHGSMHGMAKLSKSDIDEIRLMKTLGYNQPAIAEKFNIHQSTVSRIVSFKRRKID